MKFIITENKLDSVVDSYLSKQFKDLEHVKYGSRDIWVGSDKRPVIIILKDKKYSDIYILDTVYASTHDMFSMNGFKDIQYHLLKWFEEHMDIDSEEVFTFDNEGVDYVY
jgi:hypothetical protein